MSKQKIGSNPLETLWSDPKQAKDGSKPETKPKNLYSAQQRLTVQISDSVVERAKNAVYWTRGLTLAQLTQQALEKALDGLEKKTVVFDCETGKPIKEKGEPFPQRTDKLKLGRPLN